MLKAITFLSLCVTHCVFTIDIGSDSVVNRFNTQQILNRGDRIAGFAAIASGLRLDGSLTSVTFDSFMGVSGDIEMDGGKLILNKDLKFDVPTTWLTIGTIVGNSHSIEFARTMTVVAASSYAGPSGGNTLHDCDITFTITTNVVAAAITSVDWSYDDRFIAVCLANNGGNEVRIYEFDNAAITLTSRAGVNLGATANSLAWHPTKDILAVGKVGGLLVDELYTFTYSRAAQAITQLTNVSFSGLSGNGVNCVAWHPSGDYLACAGQTDTAEIRVYPVNADGTLDTGGVLTVDISGTNDANVVSWSASGDRLAVGLAGGTQLQVYTFASSPSLSLTLNASLSVSSAVNTIDWNSVQTDILAVGLATASSPQVRFYTHDSAGGTLTEISTGLSLTTQVMSVDWLSNGTCLAVGKVANSAGELSTYRFVNNALSVEEDIEIGFAVNSAVWSHNGKFLATGDSNGDLTVYMLDSAFANTGFCFSDLGIYLNADLTLQNCKILFAGNSFIDGRDHVLSLAPTCTISIANNGTLQCSNLTIKGVDGVKLQCQSSSSKLILDNATLQLDDDYYFTLGTLDILRAVQIEGYDTKFIYQSSGQLTIRERSSLLFDLNATLSCDTASSSFINFYDYSSKLILDGATLHATMPGLQLTKGTLAVADTSNIESETGIVAGIPTDNGITFGNGNSDYDLRILIAFNAMLQCAQGSINYNNVATDSFNNSNSTDTQFVTLQAALRMQPGTMLRLYQDLVLGPSAVVFDANTVLARAAGKTIKGATQVFGALSITAF